MAGIEWIEITKFKPIGAVGFIGNDAVAIAAFYDDDDINQDGKVNLGEKIASYLPLTPTNRNITEVAMQARVDMDVLLRDPTFNTMAARLYQSFASALIAEGIYMSYMARGVSMTGKGVAKKLTSGMVKEFVVRKGFESSVKAAFMKAAGV